MPPRKIVRNQTITPEKIRLAKKLRKEMTPEEIYLWGALRGNRLSGFHFRRQQVVDGYILDFYCHSAYIAIELDGNIHDQRKDYDQERDKILLEKRNLLVMRIKNEQVRNNLPAVLKDIETECNRRIEAISRRKT